MKKHLKSGFSGLLLSLLPLMSLPLLAQTDKSLISGYLSAIKISSPAKIAMKYRMTAIYTNRDLYGNFTGKTLITGDCAMRSESDTITWNNVFLSSSDNYAEPFGQGKKLDYAENFSYVPSFKMLEAASFKGFPNSPEAVLAKNLVWDMMTIQEFGLKFLDSLKLNQVYRIRDTNGKFAMADVGNYTHTQIQLSWTGISVIDEEICAVVEYRAIDNMIELNMTGFKSEGTEQYWGTAWVSLKTGMIARADMYSGTIQELEISGMKDKLLVKTIRELQLDKIQ
jgi:hypothetical protein